MEATASIAIIETDLRRLVDAVLTRAHGTNWYDRDFDAVIIAKLHARLEEERKRRSPAKVPDDLLAYTHLYELRRLIEKQWQSFAGALGEKREFSVLMDKVEDFRNAPAHSRELLPHERALLEGISGDIRTKVTLYLSEQSTDSMHYPIIESLHDSFGNAASGLGDGSSVLVVTNLRLQVGQIVDFVGRAWDPQGRELTWKWGVTFAGNGGTTIGSDVKFSWSPTEADVGRRSLEIQVSSTGPYHRYVGYDHCATFVYKTDPPTANSSAGFGNTTTGAPT